jgi:hypothetical protein
MGIFNVFITLSNGYGRKLGAETIDKEGAKAVKLMILVNLLNELQSRVSL